MELGVRVRLRDVDTLDDVAVLTAPDPVEPGDLLASVDEVYVVEAVLPTPPGARVVPALARRLELDESA
jgi:hypothetical protein